MRETDYVRMTLEPALEGTAVRWGKAVRGGAAFRRGAAFRGGSVQM